MSKWKVRVWCKECGFEQDPMGCFEGGSEVLDEVFDTKEAAEDIGADYGKGAPWDFEVFPHN